MGWGWEGRLYCSVKKREREKEMTPPPTHSQKVKAGLYLPPRSLLSCMRLRPCSQRKETCQGPPGFPAALLCPVFLTARLQRASREITCYDLRSFTMCLFRGRKKHTQIPRLLTEDSSSLREECQTPISLEFYNIHSRDNCVSG